MQITRLIITNVRDIDRLELTELPKSVSITGMNGQGKSSILNAIRMLLFGWCQLTSKKGDGADRLIRDNEAEAVIEAQFDGHLTAAMTIAATGKKKTSFTLIDDDTGVIIAESREKFWELVGANPDLATVTAFPDMYVKSKEIGDTLASFLVSEVSEKDLLKYVGSHADWLKGFCKKNRIRLTDLDTIGEKAYSERRDANRDVKRDKDAVEQQGFVKQPVNKDGTLLGTKADLDRVVDGITSLKSQRDELLKQSGASSSRPASEISADLSQAMDDHFKAKKAFEETQKTVSALNADIVSAQSKISAHTQQSSNTLAMIDKLKKAMSGCENGDTCPTCQRPFTADDRPLIQSMISDWQQKLDEFNAKREQLLADLNELRASYKEAEANNSELYKTVSALDYRLATLRDEQSKLVNAPPVENITEQIEELDVRIQNGERIRDELKIYIERQLTEERIKMLESDIENYTWAVQEFKEGTAIKHLAGGCMDNFTSRCNVELEPFGYSMAVSIDGKNVEIMLSRNGGYMRPVSHCSNGEQTLAAWAMALAFADTGTPVLLDDLNQLDFENRSKLLERLTTESIGSVFVASAIQSDTDETVYTVNMENGVCV